MDSALFINGVYRETLQEIEIAQHKHPGLTCYLQPYKSQKIKLLEQSGPMEQSPILLYLSLTDSLNVVSFKASIVGWRDKRKLSTLELAELNVHIKEHQNSEGSIYSTAGKGNECINLIAIRGLTKLNPFSTSCLRKTSDGKPLRPRTQAGGWCPIQPPPAWLGVSPMLLREDEELALQQAIKKSVSDGSENRKARLATASKTPEIVEVVSKAYRRNPDVIAEVLSRANGKCEKCLRPAPFARTSDGSPYLEVHHKIWLANGGEDSVENAIALCPNCHREEHFGTVVSTAAA